CASSGAAKAIWSDRISFTPRNISTTSRRRPWSALRPCWNFSQKTMPKPEERSRMRSPMRALSRHWTIVDLSKGFIKVVFQGSGFKVQAWQVIRKVFVNFKARRVVLVLVTLCAGMFDLGSVSAQERLRVAWAGGASSAPIWIVQEKGLLKKQGVNAEII